MEFNQPLKHRTYNPRAPLGPPDLEATPFIGYVHTTKKIHIGLSELVDSTHSLSPEVQKPSQIDPVQHYILTILKFESRGIYVLYIRFICTWYKYGVPIPTHYPGQCEPDNIAFSTPTYFRLVWNFRHLYGIPLVAPKIIAVPMPTLFLRHAYHLRAWMDAHLMTPINAESFISSLCVQFQGAPVIALTTLHTAPEV